MSISLIIFILIFSLLVKYDKNYSHAYSVLLGDINISKLFKSKQDEKKKTVEKVTKRTLPQSLILLRNSGYNRIYNTSIVMWKKRPLTGFGLKSFRTICWGMLKKDNVERKVTKKPQYMACANHSHNYYLELISEAGIVGTSLIVIFILILMKDSFSYIKKYNRQKNSEMNLLMPIIILFFLEVWPIKSTGSFFTTWGATFFWLNTAMLISATTKKSL